MDASLESASGAASAVLLLFHDNVQARTGHACNVQVNASGGTSDRASEKPPAPWKEHGPLDVV